MVVFYKISTGSVRTRVLKEIGLMFLFAETLMRSESFVRLVGRKWRVSNSVPSEIRRLQTLSGTSTIGRGQSDIGGCAPRNLEFAFEHWSRGSGEEITVQLSNSSALNLQQMVFVCQSDQKRVVCVCVCACARVCVCLFVCVSRFKLRL